MTTPGQIRGGYGERQIKTARCGAGSAQEDDSAPSRASARRRHARASIARALGFDRPRAPLRVLLWTVFYLSDDVLPGLLQNCRRRSGWVDMGRRPL